jgi:hypothetical protein
LITCRGSESDEGTGVVTFITVSSNKVTSIIGNPISFTSNDNLNNDITTQSTFYVNGTLVTNNTFTPTQSGIYKVYAKMGEFQSKTLDINVIQTTGINFVHRALYEDYTGTWCGNCPLAVVRFDNLVLQNDKVVLLGIHGPTGSGDPYMNATSQGITTAKNVYSYPYILLNGKYSWNTNNNNYTDMSFALQYIHPFSKIGIAVNTTTSGNNVTGDVKLSFAQNYSNLKVAVYVVENKLYHDQKNYFNGTGGKPIFFGGVENILNYEHHNVLRDKTTEILGDAIPSNQTQENMLFSKSINYNIPTGLVKDNLKLVVVVMDSNNEVLNTREVTLNTNNQLETI